MDVSFLPTMTQDAIDIPFLVLFYCKIIFLPPSLIESEALVLRSSH